MMNLRLYSGWVSIWQGSMEVNGDIKGSRFEAWAGWILAVVCLVIFLLSPNVKMTNGDVPGWVMFLDEYADAEGGFVVVSEPRAPEPGYAHLTEEELAGLAGLGERERSAGWWVLWHPHHLLYLPVTAALFRIVKHIEPNFGAVTFLQYWNALACAAMVLLLFRLLVRLVPRSPFILPWMLFLVSSVTFFHYATDGSQYPTAIFFMVVASGGILAFVERRKPGCLLRASVWMALAILFHQIVSIIVPFILVGAGLLVSSWRKEGDKVEGKWIWSTVGIALGLPVLVYVMVGAMALGPTGEFTVAGVLQYATLFAHQSTYWTSSAWEGLLINLQTFVGFYFGEARTSGLFIQSPFLTALVIILPMLWIAGVVNARKLRPVTKWWVGLCLMWIAPMLIFLSFWNPGHDFYHLFLTIPLSCLAVIGAESARRQSKRRWIDLVLFWAWCIVAIIINLPLTLAGTIWYGGN